MHCTSRLLAIVMGFLCLVGVSVSSVLAQEVPLTADQIQKSIEKAREFLLKSQAADGSWDPPGTQFDKNGHPTHTWGGYTALATYALLASGSKATDPPITKAVAWLEKCQMKGVYAVGVRMQVWLLLYQQTGPNDKQARGELTTLASKDFKQLITWLRDDGPYAGLWTYFGKADRIDHSVSQYGVLGLWAAAQMGGEIPDKSWKLMDKAWRAGQFPDGGWSYSSSPALPNVQDAVRPPMTAAGIASLFIIQDYSTPAAVKCEGDVQNNAIENGLSWITNHFAAINDPYTYYGIERIGVASGYKYFGDVDWFQQIGHKLVGTQGADGSWSGWGVVAGTSFGLLFLARGGAPVMMNKLDYSSGKGHGMHDAHWNERPRDAFNIARWTGVESEADNLNWQVVNLQVPALDLHDAPILYISGDRALKLPAQDEATLKQFVEQGGMILGNADCGSEAFTLSFKKLAQRLFPKYEGKDLGKGDIIFTGETYTAKNMRGREQIWAVDNGVRKIMVLFPADPARRWETNSTKTDTSAFMVGADVFFYATDLKGLRNKADTFIVTPDKTAPRKSIKVARLMVGNNPDPEPGGWTRLAAILHNAPYSLGITVTPVKPGDVLAGNYQVVHLTGTTAFKLDSAEQTILKDFINKGGTLIIDAAGGNGTFAESADEALTAMFPNEAPIALKKSLLLTDPIYNLPNALITAVKYRRYAAHNMAGSLKVPHVHGIEIGKRMAIFFSREDLSAGMVGEQVDGITGYDPDSATAIMRNLVLFAAK